MEAPEGLMAGRQKVQEREARELDPRRRTVEDRKNKEPQVDPWAEAEARVDPLRKANLTGLNDHCPTKGLDPRLALGRWNVELKISPEGAEMRGAEPECRQMVCLGKVQTEPRSSLEEDQWQVMTELFGLRLKTGRSLHLN